MDKYNGYAFKYDQAAHDKSFERSPSASAWDTHVYCDEISAAYAADSIAENLAESEREYRAANEVEEEIFQ